MGKFSELDIALHSDGALSKQDREDFISLLSFKGFTSDALAKKSDEDLRNLYVEYVVLAEDYV